MEIEFLQEELLTIHHQLSKLRKKDGKTTKEIMKKPYQFKNQPNLSKKKLLLWDKEESKRGKL